MPLPTGDVLGEHPFKRNSKSALWSVMHSGTKDNTPWLRAGRRVTLRPRPWGSPDPHLLPCFLPFTPLYSQGSYTCLNLCRALEFPPGGCKDNKQTQKIISGFSGDSQAGQQGLVT